MALRSGTYAAALRQELAAALPDELREFLEVKYGIGPPGTGILRVNEGA
jgi:hypothetical protein